jgi:hypothetical protein
MNVERRTHPNKVDVFHHSLIGIYNDTKEYNKIKKEWRQANKTFFKNLQKFYDNFRFSLFLKIALYFSQSLYKGSPSYRRSPQNLKENIQHLKRSTILTFYLFY